MSRRSRTVWLSGLVWAGGWIAAGVLGWAGPSRAIGAETEQPNPSERAEAAQRSPDAGESIRVGGDVEIAIREQNGKFFDDANNGMVTTKLPEGYPRPTPFGAIELKGYPTVRRAEVSGDGSGTRRGGGGFWPLFRHISERDIAMTAPVEMDLPGWSAKNGSDAQAWTMSFLYEKPDLGPTGDAGGRVTVVDADPMVVIAIGLQGGYYSDGPAGEVYDEALETLEEWVASHGGWEQAGPPRTLAYNGPMVPAPFRWGEVQIPVEPAADGAEPAPDAPDSADADETRGG